LAVNDKRCSAVKRDGSPCESTIITPDGLCVAHSPRYAQARSRAASKAGASTSHADPELKEIRLELARLMMAADSPDADQDRIDLSIRVARARIYAIKTDHEIRRSSAEVAELEDAYDRLLSDYEDLRDGHAAESGPEGWYLRREAEE
jgi:hypothetical protein